MPPTLARRYIFKLAANLVSVPIYLVMEAILPRALGPQTYGNYSFATSVFQQFSGFLDMGTSTCFYNALSRRQNESSLFSFYLRIAAIVAILMLLAGTILLLPQGAALLMPDVPPWFAPLAALWALLTWWGRVLRSMNDALGETIPSEIWRASLAIAGVALLAALFCADCLNVETLFAQQYLLLASTAVAYWLVCKYSWQKKGINPHPHLDAAKMRVYSREFFNYSHPLLVQALLSFAMLAAERWLLQWFDGSAQQGFYALSQKVGMACFLFVSAMTPLLMREFSIAWGKKDLVAMGALLNRFAPLLYVLAAYFSCFTLVEGRALVDIFGGAEFSAATLPVQIMALYPLHQAYGQMAGSVFHASGKTTILRNMTAFECVYGLATAWFLLAPAQLGGLNLGATGLAIKTVGVQFLTVNICLWLASRIIPFSFWRNLAHQVASLCALLALAWFARQLTFIFNIPEQTYLLRFLLSGIIYTVFVAALCVANPRIIGMTRQDVHELVRRLLMARKK